MDIKDHLHSWLDSIFYRPRQRDDLPTVLSRTETLKHALQNFVPLSRFGDGEMQMARYYKYPSYTGIHFQRAHRDLGERLYALLIEPPKGLLLTLNFSMQESRRRVVIRYERSKKVYGEYESVHSHCDVGILDRRKTARYWRTQLNSSLKMSKAKVLGDATCFILSDFYHEYATRSLDSVLMLYSEFFANKKVLFVGPDTPHMGPSFQQLVHQGTITSPSSIEFLSIPSQNCFENYEWIKRSIVSHSGIESVFIQAGPTATVLVADLWVNHGLLCYDVGSWGVSLERVWDLERYSF